MMFFMPIAGESPERVTKVGILTRKLVWMVWTPLPPDGVQLELEVQWPASDSDATASESDASCPVTAASRGGVGSAALVSHELVGREPGCGNGSWEGVDGLPGVCAGC